MIATLDGHAAVDGRSAALGDEADLEMLLELRALADAVLIGTGTLRAEGYAQLVRSPERRARRVAAGLVEDPPAVLISRRFDIPWEAGLFAAPDQPVLIYASADGVVPDVAAPVEVVRLDDATPAAVLADLRARGVRALLCEGGPTLMGALLHERLVDEVFLTLAPQLAGGGTGPTMSSGPARAAPAELELVWALERAGSLYLRYAVGRG